MLGVSDSGIRVSNCRRQLNTDHCAACRQLVSFRLPLTATKGDKVFRDLVLARIIEPSSKGLAS